MTMYKYKDGYDEEKHKRIGEKGICEECGSVDGRFCADPYLEDVEEELVYLFLCDNCYDKNADEI